MSILLNETTHSLRSRYHGKYPVGLITSLAWVGFIFAWFVGMEDLADRATLVLWCAALLLSSQLLGKTVRRFDLRIIMLMAIIPANLFSSVLPLLVPFHGGSLLAGGQGYDFCEIEHPKGLLVSIPACTSISDWRFGYDDCRAGRIASYDPETFEPNGEFRFWSDEYFGRLEQLVCLDDEVHVAVQQTYLQGERRLQTALSFSPASPKGFRPLAGGDGVGASIAYDARRDAVFYTAEFTNKIVRVDRKTGRRNTEVGDGLQRSKEITLLSGIKMSGSLAVNDNSIHPGRDRLYVADWLHGKFVHAIDLETLRPTQRFGAYGGGSLGVTVDIERDRLLVSTIWGLEIFDLETNALLLRKRLGLFNRPPVIDQLRNRIYISSTVEGKIRVLDRDTYEVIGQIPIGMGPRHLYLSHDGKRLFGSTIRAHYYWDLGDPGI
jgi:hypothetical protein